MTDLAPEIQRYAIEAEGSPLIQRVTTSPVVREGEIAWPVDPAVDDETHYFIEPGTGALGVRPTLGVPRTQTLTPGEEWQFLAAPSGTKVEIDGRAAGTSDEVGLTLRFDFPATYHIWLMPPEPWLGGPCTVTVAS